MGRKKKQVRQTYEYNGVPLIDYCREHGLCYQAVWNRIKKGKSVEDALFAHFNLAGFCREKGVCYGTVRTLMSKGQTLDEAVETCLKSKETKILLKDGTSLSKACVQNKIIYTSVFYRVKVLGETPDEALAYFLEKQNEK